MTTPHDLGPAARQMATLLAGVTDDQLTAPTPCAEYTLGDLIDHVSGLSMGLAASANKDLVLTSAAPSGDASRLEGDWRTRIPKQLDALVEAWRAPAAWEGMTKAGGVDLPGEIAGKVTMNELLVHGWDVARASGQSFDCDAESLNVALEFASMAAEQSEGGGGPFGPPVEVPADAPVLDRVIALTGRDPHWQAS